VFIPFFWTVFSDDEEEEEEEEDSSSKELEREVDEEIEDD
jgi:hypothetical protein